MPAPRRFLPTSIRRTFNIDHEDIEHRITPRTRAILPVDQLGMPCEIDHILETAKRHGLLVIQDAACAFASRFRDRPVGADAPITLFSLHARKVVTTAEGGMIVTHDGDLAARLKRLRHQGMSLSDFERHDESPTTFETYPEIGYNFRITDVQAAIGLCQLDRLHDMLARRRSVAERYMAALGNVGPVEMPFVPDHVTPNWQSFQVRMRPGGSVSRNDLMQMLHQQGIATRRGVMASHREAPYRHMNAQLPATERAADECLQLPMHAGMSDSDVDSVIAALQRVDGNQRLGKRA